MKTTLEYLEDAKSRLGMPSNYAMARWLEVSDTALSQYKTGKRVIDDYTAVRIAEALGLDPMEVVATANLEREKDAKRQAFWEALRRQKTAAALAFFAVFSGAYNTDTEAGKITEKSTNYTLYAL